MFQDAVFEFVYILFVPWDVLGGHSSLDGFFLKGRSYRHVPSKYLYVLCHGFDVGSLNFEVHIS